MAGERAARPAFPARAFHRQECLDPAIAIAIAVRRVQVDRDRTMVARQPPFEAAQARARLDARSSAARIAPRRAGGAVEAVDDAKAPPLTLAMRKQRGAGDRKSVV